MTKLEDLINILNEIANLDPENQTAQVYISGKYIFITRPDQDEGYQVEIK